MKILKSYIHTKQSHRKVNPDSLKKTRLSYENNFMKIVISYCLTPKQCEKVIEAEKM